VRGHPDRQPVPGVMVVRLDAPLFWANAAAIEERLIAQVGKWEDTHALVLDLEATTQLDTTAADMVEHLYAELADLDVQLYLARVLHRVEAVLERSGFLAQLGSEHVWHSISQCVQAATRDIPATAQGTNPPDSAAEPVGGETKPATPSPVPAIPQQADVEVDDEVEVIADDTDVASSRYLGASGDRRDNALSLFLLAIRDGHPRAAASAYTGARLIQHRRGVRDGAAGFVEFFEPFIERNPVRDVRIVRSIEDGRLVFLQAFVSLNHGESEWVATAFFDTDADDRVIEQWSVVAPFLGSTKWGRTAIDGPTEISDPERTGENKTIVRKMIKRVLMPGGKPSQVDRYFSDSYVRHDDELAEGVRTFHDLATTSDALVYNKIVLLVGEGDFVATLCKVRKSGMTYAQTDIFRLEHNLIVEHWATSEIVLPEELWVNSGPF
jgi:predicted SnoaL-like aldol condensation-catalyzing enzyme/anti-anti-sigma regulatory factor